MPRAYTSEELEHDAQTLYRAQNYKEALVAIQRSVSLAQKPSAPQLDMLVACLHKTGDTDAALEKSKAIIRGFPQHPTGYLRAAHVLQALDKPQAAAKIIERGVQTVPKTHARYQKLTQKHAQMSGGVAAVGVDPLASLPLETVLTIMDLLPFRTRVVCTRVCKSWRSLIHRLPQLWRDIDLTGTRKWVSGSFINRCFTVSQHQIEKATICRVRKLDMTVEMLLRKCKSLHTLHIVNDEPLPHTLVQMMSVAPKLSHLWVGCMFHDSQYTLFQKCASLESLRCEDMRTFNRFAGGEPQPLEHLSDKVKELHLEYPRGEGSGDVMTGLLERGQHLSVLKIRHFDAVDLGSVDLNVLTSLERLEVLETRMIVRTLPARLKVLVIDHEVHLESHPSASGPDDLPEGYLSQLKCLECADVEQAIRVLNLRTGGSAADRDLTSLTVTGFTPRNWRGESTMLTFESLRLVSAERMKSLRTLSLKSWTGMDDTIVPCIVKNMLDLQHVDLSSSDITGYGVKMLVTALPLLRSLRLDFCERLSYDAVEWARGRGLQVSCSRPDVKTGKRVRYG